MEDMAPELLQTIRLAWQKALISDAELRSLTKRITEGKATYKEVEDIAYRVGKDLSKALVGNITSDIMPDGHVPQNVAEKILQPTLREAHAMVIEAATKTQEAMNKAAGIGLKAQAAEFDAEKAQGLVYKLTNGLLEDTGWILDAPVTEFVQSSADRTMKKNVDFQARAGLHPIITRKAEGKCCKWCSNLEGSYEYGDEPKDIYRRHRRCRCVVDYRPGNGKRQNVWSKEWHEDAQPEVIEERKRRIEELSREREAEKKVNEMYRKINREKAEDGHEIIDERTYKKVTEDFIKNGGIIIRGEEAERHLAEQGATAAYLVGAQIAFIKDDATVSDVLEEMYHAFQDKSGMFGKELSEEVLLRREIDAQKYLLRRKKRYKIPIEEEKTTRGNLEYYKRRLKELEESL